MHGWRNVRRATLSERSNVTMWCCTKLGMVVVGAEISICKK